MVDFTLNELKEYLQNAFKRWREYDNSSLDAASRCFYEYESIMEDGLTEKIVCTLIIGQLLKKSGGRIFIGQCNLVVDAIDKVFGHENELDLTKEEKIEVINLAKELQKDLPKMTIVYDPKVK